MEGAKNQSELDSLLNLISDAHSDVLQESWDRKIITLFKEFSTMTMPQCMREFICDEQITMERLYELKRTPRFYRQQKCNVMRFISAYLPALSEKLWDSNLSTDQLVAWLNKGSINTSFRLSDSRKIAREKGELSHAKSIDARTRLESQGYLENLDVFARRNWNQVKAVRARR
jgi:hypothetical protein